MRSSLSVCCLAIVLGTGCYAESDEGDRSAEYADDSDQSQYDESDEPVYDESDGPVSWHDASIPSAPDAGFVPNPPPGWPVDASCEHPAVPTPEDASAPAWTAPSHCVLLRLGDDRSCVATDLLEREARAACHAQRGELKALTFWGTICAYGATAAEATCCASGALGVY
jgi:hypothetical protein